MSNPFLDTWWDLSHQMNVDRVYFDTYEEAKEKIEYYLNSLPLDGRSKFEPLVSVSWDSGQNRYRPVIDSPDLHVLVAMETIEGLFERPDIVSVLVGGESGSFLVDATINEHDTTKQEATHMLMTYAHIARKFLKPFGDRERVILHFYPRQSGRVVEAKGSWHRGCMSLWVPIDRVLAMDGERFLVDRQGGFEPISAESSYLSDCPVTMAAIYQPWDKNTIDKLNASQIKKVRSAVSVHDKVRNAPGLGDDVKSHIAVLFQDPRVLGLIKDPEIRASAERHIQP